MDEVPLPVYDRRVRAFRHVALGPCHGHLCLEVIGYRMPFPDIMSARTADSWFAFHFHDPVLLGEEQEPWPTDTVWLVPPGGLVWHKPQGKQLRRSWWRVRGQCWPDVVARMGWHANDHCVVQSGQALEGILLQLYQASLHPGGLDTTHLEYALGHWLCVARQLSIPKRGNKTQVDIPALRRHIDTHWALPLSLDALARIADCSRSQLSRSFRAAMGCSVLAYVQRLRLEAACEQLLGHERPDIVSIAQRCGFSDRYHFTRIFSRSFGQGPVSWAQAQRGQTMPKVPKLSPLSRL